MKENEIQKKKASLLWFDPVQVEQLSKEVIYMDQAATTYPKPDAVCQAMDEVNRYLSVNTGRGSYQLAQIAVEGMDAVRAELLQMIHATQDTDVVFSASATMAMNQIIGGRIPSQRDRVYVSPFLHNAVMRTLWKKQQECGYVIETLPLTVDKLTIDLEKTKYLFTQKPPTYVFCSQVCNVTGYEVPVEEIFYMAKEASKGEAVVVNDAAQSFGILPIDYRKTPYDAIVFAGHKTLYGPFGIAGFIKKKDLQLEPFLAGGTGSDSLQVKMPQQLPQALEPGSPNITAIAGLYGALQFRKEIGAEQLLAHERALTKQLLEGLRSIEDVVIFGDYGEKQLGIVSFGIKGYRADEVGMLLEEDYNIAVRTGYHCAPLIHKYLQDEEYGGTVRVSVGWFNTEEDVRKLLEAVEEIAEG